MKRHSKSNMTSLAIAAFLAVASLSSSSAHAITATGPLTANSGNNDVTIGAWNFLGTYFIAKCEDNVFATLTKSDGNWISLGASPNLIDNVEFRIFQNGNDVVRKVNTGGMSCAGFPMVPLQSNGRIMTMRLSGGNDTVFGPNLGGPMQIIAGVGDDFVTLANVGQSSTIWGEAGSDNISASGWAADTLFGGDGNDFLSWAGAGSNTCSGGAGADTCSAQTCTIASSCTFVNP